MDAFAEPRGAELISRYKEQYGIPDEAVITEEMILRHWEREKSLVHDLLSSTPQNRWEVFARSYTRLFDELWWLNQLTEKKNVKPPAEEYKQWLDIIGPPPQRIFEIGSGEGRMISLLATLGHECHATEITPERGEKHVGASRNITWSVTDGIHLDKFEKTDYYDVVLCKAVIEHLHPDDIAEHFRGASRILKSNGKYIFFTVQKFFGPWDISNVFRKPEPMGMHLKEYMICELLQPLRAAGFKRISFPAQVFSKRYHRFLPFVSDEVLWVALLERLLVRLPRRVRNRFCRDRRVFPVGYIFLIAHKE